MNELKQVCQIQELNYRKVKRIWNRSNDVQKKILTVGFKIIINENNKGTNQDVKRHSIKAA